MDAYVHRSSRKKPEERQEVEEGLLKLVARFYARIRPALFAWLRPLEVAKEILLGYKLFEDGPPASKNMPWLGMAWGRFVAAAQHVDQDATLGMLICVDVDDPNRVLRGSHFYFGGLDILIKLNHGDVLLFDPRLQHGVTEPYYSEPPPAGSRPWRALLSLYLKDSHLLLATCHPPGVKATK